MELRLNFDNLLSDNLIYSWDFSSIYKADKIKLLDKIKNKEDFAKYIKQQFEAVFLNK